MGALRLAALVSGAVAALAAVGSIRAPIAEESFAEESFVEDAGSEVVGGRRLSSSSSSLPHTFVSAGIFPGAIEERNADGVSFLAKKSFGRAVSMSRDGEYFAVAQPYAFEAFAAPPGAAYVNHGSVGARKQTGAAIFGKAANTRAVVTQRDISSPGLPEGASYSKGGVSLSADGDVLAAGAQGTATIYLYKGCKSEAGCMQTSTIVDWSAATGGANYFGYAPALSPDARFIATSNPAETSVSVFPLSHGVYTGAAPIIVNPPVGFAFDTANQWFGANVQLTSNGRRLVVGVASATNPTQADAVLVFRRKGATYEWTDTLTPAVDANFGYLGAYHSIAVADYKESGNSFVLAFVQPLYNHVSVYTCSGAATNSCALQSTFPTTPMFGETNPTVAVAVSRGGHALVVAGWSANSGSVYVYERPHDSWLYGPPVFSSALYGGFGESGAPGRMAADIASDGSRFIVGNGGTNGAATLFTRVTV